MKYYRITARLLAPLMVQQNRQSNAPQGMPYLPGSSLRGALAAGLLRLGGSPEESDFRFLFLDHPACFPNLLPTDDPVTLSQVLPHTSISCKRTPGFKGQGGHGVSDILTGTAAGRTEQKSARDDFCPSCGDDMSPFPGFWNGNVDTPCAFEPTMLYERHTGIDRNTGTVASSIFFTMQAVADFRKDTASGKYQPQYLSGSTFLSEKQLHILGPLIKGTLFAGSDRTRGLGEFELSIVEIPSPVFDLAGWDRAFKEKLKSIMKEDLPSGLYFSIKLESHAIVTDRFLRPASGLELSFPDIEPVLKVTKPQTIRGWHSGWGLPKPDDVALSMGSVFLFRYTGDDQDGLKSFLNQLLVTAIGLRREEGFGQFSVCDPLHIMEVI